MSLVEMVLRPVHARRLLGAQLVVCNMSDGVDGEPSENQWCTTSRKVVHDLKKNHPMFYFGTTNSIPGVKTTNHTAYFVAMTTRYDVVFYLRLLGGKLKF